MTPSGPTPLEGVLVRYDARARDFLETATDSDGLYTLSVVSPSATINQRVTASKVGYTTIATDVAAITDDTRLDFQLSRNTYTLSGVVFEVTETGRLPIEGVELYCDGCGSPVGHTFTGTDANGHYGFEWTPNGATPLRVRKEGYALAGSQPGPRSDLIIATVEGDTRFDIELVRR